MQNLAAVSPVRVRICTRFQNLGMLESHSLGTGVADCVENILPQVCFRAEIGRSRSSGTSGALVAVW